MLRVYAVRLQLAQLDASCTVVTGPGSTTFMLGEPGRAHSVFHVTLADVAGAPVIVKPRAVRVSLRRPVAGMALAATVRLAKPL
jgi:hypothetical protein